MNHGLLNKYIDLLESVAINDGQGGRQQEWQLFRSVHASISQQEFSAASVQGADASLRNSRIVIRKIAAEFTGWRIRYKDEFYEVLHCDNSLPDQTILECRKIIKR